MLSRVGSTQSSISKVRLIAVEPLGEKVWQYINFIKGHSNVEVELCHNNALPNGRTYPYKIRDANTFFEEHFKFYLAQIALARQNDQFPMLVSGETHHYSAPFLVALQRAYDVLPKVVSFDNHSDCYSTRLDQGGFWLWLIGQQHLIGTDINLVGAKVEEPRLKFAEYYPVTMLMKIKEGFSAAKDAMNTDWNDFDLSIETLVVRELCSLARHKSYFLSQGVFLTPFGCKGQSLRRAELDHIKSLTIKDIFGYCLNLAESQSISENGIRLIASPSELERALPPDRPIFVSIDTDVSYDKSFSIVTLSEHLKKLSHRRLLGMHVEEFDSPSVVTV